MGGFANQSFKLTQHGGWNCTLAGLLDGLFGPSASLGVSSGVDSEGWHTYIDDPPPEDALCQFKTLLITKYTKPWVGYASELHPQGNANGLKWRLTGIAREQLEDTWWSE